MNKKRMQELGLLNKEVMDLYDARCHNCNDYYNTTDKGTTSHCCCEACERAFYNSLI